MQPKMSLHGRGNPGHPSVSGCLGEAISDVQVKQLSNREARSSLKYKAVTRSRLLNKLVNQRHVRVLTT